MDSVNNIGTFIFLDLETTSLPELENNRTKITELCLIGVQVNHIRQKIYPRVQNKLNICFNPLKSISAVAEKKTGLSYSLLEYQFTFSIDTLNSINSFLELNRKPICFVAHNADNFDYPILQKEIQDTGGALIDGILCVDSIKAFRELYFHKFGSFKLPDLYTKLSKKQPINQHQAEGDVHMLITCAAAIGDRFVDWANAKAKKFCDIPPLVPIKRKSSNVM